MRAILLLALFGLAPLLVQAHGGGLDKNGCHTNRKTGEYHCHRSPTPRTTPPPPATPLVPDRGSQVYYRNCSEARAAGAAPVRAGDPGYGRHLDRDGDGVGCE